MNCCYCGRKIKEDVLELHDPCEDPYNPIIFLSHQVCHERILKDIRKEATKID